MEDDFLPFFNIPLPQEDDLPPDLEPVDDEDPDYDLYDTSGPPRQATLEDLKLQQQYIKAVADATLENTGLSQSVIDRLKKPLRKVLDLAKHTALRLSLRQFIANGHSNESYEANRRACMEEHPERELPSLKVLKRVVENLTGVKPIVTDMCPRSCMAYTGPHVDKTRCLICKEQEPRYEFVDGKRRARRTFDTYPFGPQAQALFRSRETAEMMHHRCKAMAEFKAYFDRTGQQPDIATDTYFSAEFMDAVDRKIIKPDDMCIMFSIDGAQLYESKQSDCWIYIWVLFDMSPKSRYKKRFVLPGAVIPGPNKPKDLESFLVPGLAHISALQKEGLMVWDAADNRLFRSRPIVIFATADSVAMAGINGLVGHSGAHGCRLWCPMRSRHKHGTGYYYPAMLEPHNPTPGAAGRDYSLRDPAPAEPMSARYKKALNHVLASTSPGQYEQRRLETGISKPSIFSGLPYHLDIPNMFPMDAMHHLALNVTDIMIKLWRGKFKCSDTDSVDDWPWAFWRKDPGPDGTDRRWNAHGENIGGLSLFLPGSFDRPPRNIAAKINSGFKAWEHMTHFYDFLPGELWSTMPDEYYVHLCKLIAGARFALLVETPVKLRAHYHKLLVEFVEGFETLYYQRRSDRLHFCRHSIHLCSHLVPEGIRWGPLWLHCQWCLESAIGWYTREIGSDVHPEANLAARLTRRCMQNGLLCIFPELGKREELPDGAIELGDSYVLLAWGKDKRAREIPPDDATALRTFAHSLGINTEGHGRPALWKWARLRLPNGQVARTAFGECKGERRGKPVHRSRMVKLRGSTFAEVQYFFQLNIKFPDGTTEKFALAMVSDYTPYDPAIAKKTHGALLACRYQGDRSRRVIEAKDIISVVGMLPLRPRPSEMYHPDAFELYTDRYYVAEKLGFSMTWIGREEDTQGSDDEAEEE